MGLYSIFTKTGCEDKLLREMKSIWLFDELMHTYAPKYDALYKKGGKIFKEQRCSMPGYVFVKSELSGMDFYIKSKPLISWSEYALKLLSYGDSNLDSNFEMKSDECEIFMKLFSDKGCVDISKGCIEGDLIIITDGPMVGFEGLIKKVIRHKMIAYVEVEMLGQITRMKVGLDIVSKKP